MGMTLPSECWDQGCATRASCVLEPREQHSCSSELFKSKALKLGSKNQSSKSFCTSRNKVFLYLFLIIYFVWVTSIPHKNSRENAKSTPPTLFLATNTKGFNFSFCMQQPSPLFGN